MVIPVIESGYGLYSVTFTLKVLDGAALYPMVASTETVIVDVPPPLILSLVPPATTSTAEGLLLHS